MNQSRLLNTSGIQDECVGNQSNRWITSGCFSRFWKRKKSSLSLMAFSGYWEKNIITQGILKLKQYLTGRDERWNDLMSDWWSWVLMTLIKPRQVQLPQILRTRIVRNKYGLLFYKSHNVSSNSQCWSMIEQLLNWTRNSYNKLFELDSKLYWTYSCTSWKILHKKNYEN